tara:strand:+ start:4736 stop:5746 length:1011 start_codon:yes stop_codon:yes gene_type:complete
MPDKDYCQEFNHVFPKHIRDEFLFPLNTYRLFLERLSINPIVFFNEWSNTNRQSIVNRYLKINTKLDWQWSLSFPLFTLLEKYVKNIDNPMIIGFSGLPGSGKSTLGLWINCVAKELSLDVKVISLDDFYLPGDELEIAMKGNPWNVPRGFPGSHSIELLDKSLDTFLKTGLLKTPVFEKSLRDGKGDRSGWSELKTKVLILEGWFVGCEPILNLIEIDEIFEDKFNLNLSQIEKYYRGTIQDSLTYYSKIWKKFDKLWHLKSSNFNNTIKWKTEQEKEMIKLKGSGLKDNSLTDFIRMIQTSIPQQSFSCINSDTTIEVNQNRRINNIYTNTYLF